MIVLYVIYLLAFIIFGLASYAILQIKLFIRSNHGIQLTKQGMELYDEIKDAINALIKVNNKYQTSINNVYACGDVIKKELYQLITASSEGASVANNIIKSINGSDN